MKIILPDNSVKEYANSTTARLVAQDISAGLAANAVAATANGKLVDLDHTLTEDTNLSIVTKRDPLYLTVLRHTASHMLAQAIMRLYPNTKLAIGPAIENGFYYDFDFETPINANDID